MKPKVKKNSKALELLGLQRFRLFLEAAEAQGNPPSCVEFFLEWSRKEGLEPPSQRIGTNGVALSLHELGPDYFRIAFSFAFGHAGDGGEWDVWFNPVGTVVRIELREHWIA